MATAITNDAELELDGSDLAADEFLRHLTKKDAQEPSEKEEEGEDTKEDVTETEEETEEETSDESPEDDTEEDSEETEEDDEETEEAEETTDTKAKKPTVIESEDALVKIKVDGQEVTASIKDLKRLYGQEASLTRKSQEAAQIKQKAEESGQKYVAGLESLLNRAKEQAAPYANINFLALTKDPNVSSEELAALSDAANKAFDNVRYLESELDGVIKTANEQRQQQLMVAAKEAIKVLTDPKTGIPGWNEQLYNDIRRFAVDSGMNEQVVNDMVDPTAFKILHMAMQYQKGKTAVTKTKKVDKTPKRIIKGTPDETIKKSKTSQKTDAFKRARDTGHVDDAAEAFLSRWENS
jgi:hypothetical protein